VVGAFFAVFVAIGAYRAEGPTELTLNPENQERIVSERRARELKAALDLDGEQVRQLTESVMAIREEGRRLRAENAGNMMAMMGARRLQMENFDRQVRAILREEQLPKYEEFKGLQRSRMGAVRELAQHFFVQMHSGDAGSE
jgi:hypothetical protein